jgi:hypothetical protein
MSKLADIFVTCGYLMLMLDVGDETGYALVLIGHLIHIFHLRVRGRRKTPHRR